MKPMKPEQFQKFTANRFPSRERIESIRAVGIMVEEGGDDFGVFLQEFAETLLDIRVAAKGGHRDIRSKHWNQTPDEAAWAKAHEATR